MRNVANIDGLLAATFGDQQRQYEYLPSTGMNVVQSVGPRLILGGADDLDWKMVALQTIVQPPSVGADQRRADRRSLPRASLLPMTMQFQPITDQRGHDAAWLETS